ncbi:MAG: hypothetical protein M3P16_06755 [Chloroflexota bacterium]|nr:hypothetical protein [Chloroflexota bacterium]
MRSLTPRARLLAGAIAFIVALVVAFVVTNAFATSRSVRPDGFQRTADPRQIVVIVTTGVGDEVTDHSAREDGSAVTVTVRVREPGGSRIGLGVPIPVPIALGQPLGERTVLDEGGRPVPDLGQYRTPGASGQ